MCIEGQGHFFTIYFPGFVCFVLYWEKISGERLQDHWSSGYQCLLSEMTMLSLCLIFKHNHHPIVKSFKKSLLVLKWI